MSPNQPPMPDLAAVATAMLELGRDLHLELSEAELSDRFLTTLARLFPARRIALRVLDPRTRDPARVYALGGELRPGLESDRVTIKESSVQKTRLKTAVAASARLRLDSRWDSPFSHVAAGFTVPLVASGELYGVLDRLAPLDVRFIEDLRMVLPVIFTSGFPETREERGVDLRVGQNFLRKPFRRDELAEVLRRSLHHTGLPAR